MSLMPLMSLIPLISLMSLMYLHAITPPQVITISHGTVLHAAVLTKRQQAEKLRYLLAKLPPVKELQRWWDLGGCNPLHRAVDLQEVAAIRQLAAAGFDLQAPSLHYVDTVIAKEQVGVGGRGVGVGCGGLLQYMLLYSTCCCTVHVAVLLLGYPTSQVCAVYVLKQLAFSKTGL
jgi:hypothetical protein